MPLQSITNRLAQTIGLNADSLGGSAVENAVRARLQARGGIGLDEYAAVLAWDAIEFNALIEELLVPETWFFREPEAFNELASRAQRRLQARPGRVFRVLSAPCSTGEEAYSAAIRLLEAGFPRHSFTIDAVDLSHGALEAARRGVYRMHSFRGAEPELRERHFSPHDASFEISTDIKACVQFRHANLADPMFLSGESAYDAIFCRNVLIYLHESARSTALSSLSRLLVEGGVVFAGHAEALDAMSPLFRRAGAGFAFVKRSRSQGPDVPKPLERRAPRAAPTPLPVPAPPPLHAPAAEQTDHSLTRASELADRGELEGAAQLCEDLIRARGPTADAYCLLGVIRNAQGRREAAEVCFTRVLYLEPSRAEALVHMALICERRGDRISAANYRRRAERSGRAGGQP